MMSIYEQEVFKRLETKLLELMGETEFIAFIKKACDEAFRVEIESMDDCDFKQFCLENFDKIINGVISDE